DERSVIEDVADARTLRVERALTVVVDVLHDVLMNAVAGSRAVKRHRLVALRPLAGGKNVRFTPRPPVADQPIHLVADRRGFFNGDLVHDAPAGQVDPVRVEPADLEPRGLLPCPG